MRRINATEFKATCLAVLNDVAERGEPVTIFKRGRAIAQLVPAVAPEKGYAQDALKGSVTILGDVVNPVLPPEAWEVESRPGPRSKRRARGA